MAYKVLGVLNSLHPDNYDRDKARAIRETAKQLINAMPPEAIKKLFNIVVDDPRDKELSLHERITDRGKGGDFYVHISGSTNVFNTDEHEHTN